MESQQRVEAERLIGAIATRWAALEEVVLVVYITALTGPGVGVGDMELQIAASAGAGLPLQQLWQKGVRFLEIRGLTGEAAALENWSRVADRLRVRRNEAVHASWTFNTADGKGRAFDMVSRKAITRPRSEHVSADELPELLIQIDKALDEIHALLGRLT